MTWPIDKVSLINQQLSLSGNNNVTAADDGSDEWNVTSAAYEYAIEYMFDSHDWKQITNVVTLQPSPAPPSDNQFDTAFVKPADCVHVIWCRVNQAGTALAGSEMPILYQILNNQIVVNLFGQPPGVPPPAGTVTPIVTMKYVSSNPPVAGTGLQGTTAAAQMLRTFMTALGRFVLAGIYRGLHEDIASARAEEKIAIGVLQEAKTRSDQEQPKRAPFNSRIAASRRVRRPFPITPTGWGGTGIPG